MSEQYGFYVDASRCIKCYSCEIACKQWHATEEEPTSRRHLYEECTGAFPYVSRSFASLSCMHCDQPACVQTCPVKAITKRKSDGIVIVDKTLCIGCRSCSLACPFGAPHYGEKKIMDKCDACISLGRNKDEEPRCVLTCPTKSLHFGKLDDLKTIAAKKGWEQWEGDTGPSVIVTFRTPKEEQ